MPPAGTACRSLKHDHQHHTERPSCHIAHTDRRARLGQPGAVRSAVGDRRLVRLRRDHFHQRDGPDWVSWSPSPSPFRVVPAVILAVVALRIADPRPARFLAVVAALLVACVPLLGASAGADTDRAAEPVPAC